MYVYIEFVWIHVKKIQHNLEKPSVDFWGMSFLLYRALLVLLHSLGACDAHCYYLLVNENLPCVAGTEGIILCAQHQVFTGAVGKQTTRWLQYIPSAVFSPH